MEDDKVIRQMTQYKEGLVVIYTRGILQVEDIMPGLKRMKAYENVECFVQFPFHKIWRVNGIEAAGHFDTENDFFVSSSTDGENHYLITSKGLRYIVDMKTGKITLDSQES